MSVLKGYNNQEIILSNFDFPTENYSGLLVMRDKKQGNFIKSFSSQCQLGVAPEASLWGFICVVFRSGEGKIHEGKWKMLTVVSALTCPSMA